VGRIRELMLAEAKPLLFAMKYSNSINRVM